MKRTSGKSVSILIRMLICLLAGIALIVWQQDYLIDLYFRNQVTQVGWFVNGAILLLFLGGLGRLVLLFVMYDGEEAVLDRFAKVFPQGSHDDVVMATPSNSIIGRRYRTIVEFYSARTEINHNALAATLLAEETSRTSFPKFVNNVLILTGVFGTIVSLTVALLGASSVIEETESIGGLNIVIHGMSTALSTTMTAILAYFFFAYFYLKLLDTQSHILGRIEHVSATMLIPRYQVATRSPEQNLNDLLVRTAEALAHFDQTIRTIDAMSARQSEMFEQIGNIMNRNTAMLDDIRELLRDGFRLRNPEDR